MGEARGSAALGAGASGHGRGNPSRERSRGPGQPAHAKSPPLHLPPGRLLRALSTPPAWQLRPRGAARAPAGEPLSRSRPARHPARAACPPRRGRVRRRPPAPSLPGGACSDARAPALGARSLATFHNVPLVPSSSLAALVPDRWLQTSPATGPTASAQGPEPPSRLGRPASRPIGGPAEHA